MPWTPNSAQLESRFPKPWSQCKKIQWPLGLNLCSDESAGFLPKLLRQYSALRAGPNPTLWYTGLGLYKPSRTDGHPSTSWLCLDTIPSLPQQARAFPHPFIPLVLTHFIFLGLYSYVPGPATSLMGELQVTYVNTSFSRSWSSIFPSHLSPWLQAIHND